MRYCILFTFFGAMAFHAGAESRIRGEEGVRGPQQRLSVSKFGRFACYVSDDGTVRCWGQNSSGQLGNGATSANRSTPVQVSNLTGVSSVSTGDEHSCALLGSAGGGAVMCWGDGSDGQLGAGSTITSSTVPVQVKGLSGVVEIAAGSHHTCALLVDGSVSCWGANDQFQLGSYFDVGASPGANLFVPRQTLTPGGAISISAGGDMTCVVQTSRTVSCWGNNNPYMSTVASTASSLAVSVGLDHACALGVDGSARCWGANNHGQLGNGTAGQQASNPVTVSGSNMVALSAGAASTCAILAGGTAQCWGINELGELGDGTLNEQHAPTTSVAIAGDLVEIGANGCAVDISGAIHCWGDDFVGQLGNGSVNQIPNPLPVSVSGISGSISARGVSSKDLFTCARRGNGVVSCWGYGHDGEIGNDLILDSPNATNVSGLNNAINVGVGPFHACAVRSTGTVSCWGRNTDGQLGNGSVATYHATPVAVVGVANAVMVAGGLKHSCALIADGTVLCWGANDSGQLGNPVSGGSTTPVPAAISGVVAITAGFRHTCAVLSDATVRCWGDNSASQLGDNKHEASSSTPIQVTGIIYAVAISAGQFHTCSTNLAGGAYCWGDNTFGQLGDSTTQPRTFPVAVSSLPDAIGISAGYRHSCAVRSDRTAVCWGYNGFSQLGGANPGDSAAPIPVISRFATVNGVQIPIRLSSVAAITAGFGHSCTAEATGFIDCWGRNGDGEIGIGTFTNAEPRPQATNSFAANVVPAAEVKPGGRIAIVTVLVNCPVGGEAHINLTLTQGAATGEGTRVEACAGGLTQLPLTVAAHGNAGFEPGAATATVEALVKDSGTVTLDQHWTRAVTLSPPQ